MAFISRCLILLLSLITVAECRILSLNSSNDHLISDGINGQDLSVAENLSCCSHQYGFLPCADNAAGYIFLILVYQVLLIVGGMMIGAGSEVLFRITGERFGGILFRILRALPSMMLMIYSGVISDKATAQAQVSSVVGIYAGITVFSLTVQWFMVIVSASKSLKEEEEFDEDEPTSSSRNCFQIKEKLTSFKEKGVTVDEDTCRTAKIMLFSLIPYVLLQLVYAFDSSSGKRIITLIALIISSVSLISYFVYQIRDPWMQKRSLEYSKDRTITESEFIDVMVQWIEKARRSAANNERIDEAKSSVSSNERMDEANNSASSNEINVAELIDKILTENKDNESRGIDRIMSKILKGAEGLKEQEDYESPVIDKIMSKILKQAEGQMLKSEALIKGNWEPNTERIQRLFSEHDTDKDGSLSRTELKNLIRKVKFGTYQMKDKDVIKEMLRVFDKDGSKKIEEKEFMNGVERFLERAIEAVDTTETSKIVQEFDKIVWKEVYGKKALFKSIFQVLLGIAMLTFLAGPLTGNIIEFSMAMNLPSFAVSFVIVPLAMNGQVAIAALLPASKKTTGTSSLTFSEIYGGVIMNNIAGLTTLLAIVYAKDLIWDFSAEVLTIMVVCAAIGTQAFLSTTYQLWTCIPAFLLYPVSLGLFYFSHVFLSWN